MMKKRWMIILIGCLFIFPALAHAQVDKFLGKVLEGGEPNIRPEFLKVLQLEMLPDPVRGGQQMAFRATISNGYRHSGRVSLTIRDRDQIISEVRNLTLKTGNNQVNFPETTYQFDRSDHCFTIEADVERTRTPITMATESCARRTQAGWTLSDKGIGPLYVEDLEMYPDPVSPGQEISFKVRFRNDGRPIRGRIQIQDRDQIVTQVENAAIPRGLTEYQFPRSQYTFQRFDTCFTVSVDIERTPYPVDASKKYCAKPVGWTLRPALREQRGERR
jgi:hypothetical protein